MLFKLMRFSRINLVLIAVVILLSVGGFVLTTAFATSIGNLQIYSGSAEVIRDGKSQIAQSGFGVHPSDSVKTAKDSKVALVLKDSSVIRLDQETEVEIGNISFQGQKIKNADFKLKFGRLWSRVAPLSQNSGFEVETPTIVASVRGTSYNTTYKKEFTSVFVYRQLVNVILKNDRLPPQQINANSFLRMSNDQLKEDFQKGPATPSEDFFDDWIRFNIKEDDKICLEHPNTPGCENYTFSAARPSPTISPSPSSSPAVRGAKTATPTAKPANKSVATPAPTKTSNPTAAPVATINPSPSLIPSPTQSKSITDFTITHDNSQNDCYPTCQFTALAYFSDNPNNEVDVTKDTKWSINSPANGTISSLGFYTSGPVRGDTIVGSLYNVVATYTIYPPIF